MAETTYAAKLEILGQLWLEYRDDEQFSDFVEYCDLGLPLAYSISNSIVETSPMAEQFVNEAFSLLLAGLGIEDDTGFENLEELLDDSTPGETE
jgi:hypothetical protein